MTNDEINQIVHKALGGKPPNGWGLMLDQQQLARLVELVAEHERDECARICAEHWDKAGTADRIAKAIRSRS